LLPAIAALIMQTRFIKEILLPGHLLYLCQRKFEELTQNIRLVVTEMHRDFLRTSAKVESEILGKLVDPSRINFRWYGKVEYFLSTGMFRPLDWDLMQVSGFTIVADDLTFYDTALITGLCIEVNSFWK
jgi:hypothetical protein